MDDRPHRTEDETAENLFLRDRAPATRESETDRPPAGVRRGFRLGPIFLIGLAVVLGLGVYRITTLLRAPKEPTDAPSHTAAQPIGAATASLGEIKIIVNALGTVTPLATVTVKTQINGQLTEVAFKEGQTVKKGQFLAQIDPRPYELAQRQYEGQLARDQGLLDQARVNLSRYQTLLKQESIARQQAEDQAFLVKQYEGSVKTDQAQIETQKLNLIYAHIVSPIDGRVGLRLVDAGNYVQTTDSGLAVLTQIHPISVIFTVPEDEVQAIIAELESGTKLEVTAYDRANINKLAVGKVVTLDNQIDTTTGTVKLRAEFDNLDDKLFPNQFVNARLLVKTLENVVTIPTASVQRGAPGAFVYLIGADDVVSVRPIELGPTDADKVAVFKGLSPGDRVVVDGADQLRDGARIYIPAAASAQGGDAGAAAADADKGTPAGQEPAKRRNRKGQQGGQ